MTAGILFGFLLGCAVTLAVIWLGGGFDNYGE